MKGLIDQSMDYLAGVNSTYGILSNMSAALSLGTTAKKVPLTTFSGSGCSLSSNGIKVAKSGIYEVSGTAYFHTGFTVNDMAHLLIYKNSSSIAEIGKRLLTTSPYENISVSPIIIDLQANDVVYLYAYNQTGARGSIAASSVRDYLVLNRIA